MIDHNKSHEIAMRLLKESGIYVFVVCKRLSLQMRGKCSSAHGKAKCLSTPQASINRLDPYGSYRPQLLAHYFKTVDCLSQYYNVIGVIAANSVINAPSNTNAAEIIRAVVRDLKRYMRAKARLNNQRVLAVGVSNAFVPEDEATMPRYFFAGQTEDRADFWGVGSPS